MCWSTSSRIRNNRFYSAVLLRTSYCSYVSYSYYTVLYHHFGTPWSPDCSGPCTICRNIRTKFREPQEKSMRAQYIRAHVLCMKRAFSCWGQFLWCIQKKRKKTGFVFVRVKIVMHGLTVTQEFCKLSNVHICSFVCLTFVDASMESLMMNFQNGFSMDFEAEYRRQKVRHPDFADFLKPCWKYARAEKNGFA